MRTTMDLDKELLRKAVEFSGAKTKTEATNTALREYVRQMATKRLIAMLGTLDIEDNWREMEELELKEMEELDRAREGNPDEESAS